MFVIEMLTVSGMTRYACRYETNLKRKCILGISYRFANDPGYKTTPYFPTQYVLLSPCAICCEGDIASLLCVCVHFSLYMGKIPRKPCTRHWQR